MQKDSYDIILNLAPFFLIPPVLLGILNFRKHSGKLIFIYLLVFLAAFTFLISFVLWKKGINNLFILHFYTIFEFLLLSLYYYIELKGFIIKKLYIAVVAAFVIFSIANSVFLEPLTVNNTYARAVESLILISFSITVFYRIVKEARILKLEESPVFWINSAVLLYFSGNLFLFTFSNYVLTMTQGTGMQVWVFHSLFQNIYYTLITVGLWKARKNTKLNS